MYANREFRGVEIVSTYKWRLQHVTLMPGTNLLHATPHYAAQRRLTWVRIAE
jgi:hypothetical protein